MDCDMVKKRAAKPQKEKEMPATAIESHIAEDKLPSLLRRGEITRDELVSAIFELNRMTARLQSLVNEMDRHALTAVFSDGVTQLSRGMHLVEKFLPNLERAIIAAK